MSNTAANDRALHQRSEEQSRRDKISRQLLEKIEAFGFYARLYYLEEDDSYFLEWRLPGSNCGRGSIPTGDKYFTNPDECFFSWRYCAEEIEKHCERFGVVVKASARVSRKPMNCAQRPRALAPARMP